MDENPDCIHDKTRFVSFVKKATRKECTQLENTQLVGRILVANPVENEVCCGNGNSVAFVTNIVLSFVNYVAEFGLFSILIDLWTFVVFFVVITVP